MINKVKAFLKETGNDMVSVAEVNKKILHTEIVLTIKSFDDISRIERSLDGLPFYLHCSSPIIIPSPESGSFRVMIPNDTLEDVKFVASKITRPTKIFLGVDENNDALMLDLANITHSIIAGATGSGKSMVIHTIMHSLLHTESAEIFFLDPKYVEAQMYRGADNVTLASSQEDMINTLRALTGIMESRYSFMAMNGIRDAMEQWSRSAYNDVNCRPIVLLVDEVADLFCDSNDAKTLILKLSSKARAAGIRIFLATQRPDAKIIDGAIKANFTTRICMKTSSRIDSTVVLGMGGAENLRGKGHGLLMYPTGKVVPFKGARVDDVRLNAYVGKPVQPPKPPTYEDIISGDIRQEFQELKSILGRANGHESRGNQ